MPASSQTRAHAELKKMSAGLRLSMRHVFSRRVAYNPSDSDHELGRGYEPCGLATPAGEAGGFASFVGPSRRKLSALRLAAINRARPAGQHGAHLAKYGRRRCPHASEEVGTPVEN